MELLRQITWLISIGLGFLGLLLTVYSLIAEHTQAPWQPLEKASDGIASVSTLIAITAVAVVAYLPENRTPIKEISRNITAPLVLLLTAYLAFRWWRSGKPLSSMLVNGVSLLALSGSLLRMIPANNI